MRSGMLILCVHVAMWCVLHMHLVISERARKGRSRSKRCACVGVVRCVGVWVHVGG